MITPDPFGRGAYNLQSISATRKKVVWFTRLSCVTSKEEIGNAVFAVHYTVKAV